MLLRPIHTWCTLFLALTITASCSRNAASIAKSRQEVVRKYSASELRADFDVMRGIMENFHPSLYWYTSKDSMDLLFSAYRSSIKDSMTQQQFGFSVLAPLTTAIRCGHTSFSYSKKYNDGIKGVRLPSFPLFLKVYGDSMVVLGNMNRKDSILKRGTPVTSIDGYSVQDLTNIMFRFMPTDGYAENINYIRLSSSFPYYHRNIFGLKKNYVIGYIDSLGKSATTIVPLFDPASDSTRFRPDSSRTGLQKPRKPSRKEKIDDFRSLSFISDTDSLFEAGYTNRPVNYETGKSSVKAGIHGNTAVMTLNSFDDGGHLKGFFRRSFRLMKENKTENLIIDIRSNGGGKVNNYTRLASYIRPTKFKVADSAYSIRKGFSGYGKYFSARTFNAIALGVFTSKKDNGAYHFNYWENHYFKPSKKNFFKGNIYILISGPTFSASTLFAHTMKGQPNVTLVGEETGGGHHGNNGLMIPNVTLPNTKMRVRMPMFRVIQYNHTPKNGRGVEPDVLVSPSAQAVLNGVDIKMKKTFQLIDAKSTQLSSGK